MMKLNGMHNSGFSLLTLLVYILLLGGIAFIGLKIGPLYYDNHVLQKALQRLQTQVQDPVEGRLLSTRTNMIAFVGRQLKLDNVRTIPYQKMRFRRQENAMEASLSYTAQTALTEKITVHVQFHEQVLLSKQKNG